MFPIFPYISPYVSYIFHSFPRVFPVHPVPSRHGFSGPPRGTEGLGGERTRIHWIGLWGVGSEHKREAVTHGDALAVMNFIGDSPLW